MVGRVKIAMNLLSNKSDEPDENYGHIVDKETFLQNNTIKFDKNSKDL